MRDTSNISEYRDRLDQTLSSHDLVNNDLLKALVKNQMLRSSVGDDLQECSDSLIERRTKEVANFLSMLRSASVADGEKSKSSEATHGGWKVKQDTEEYRVMYREGPEGTPFHTLLVEGYVDGPADVCLCISWGAEFYNKWWPQTSIPTFKVVASECLQKVRVGEQICLVRMKLSWPLSAREAVIHFFVFEYFQDGLIVVLLNSISDIDSIDRSTHGFPKDGIPLPQDVVRIDVVGGFAIQKVTDSRSYFRTIANMDIKMDFIPPSFINFISRQLVGAGFKLFKKEVASVAKGDEDFKDALKDPLYAGTRKALYSDKIPNGKAVLELPDPKEDICRLYDEKRNGSGALELQDLKEGACVGLDEGTGDDSGALGLKDLKKDSCLQLDERTKDSNDALQLQDPLKDSCVSLDQGTRTNIQDKSPEQKVQADDSLTTSVRHDDFMAGDIKVHSEIEEINETSKMVESLDETDQIVHNSRANQPVHVPAYNKKIGISSEVCQALGTLEKAISIIRDFGYNVEIRSVPGNTTVMPAGVKEDGQKDSKSSESDRIHGSIVTRAESPKKGFLEASPYEHRNSSASQGSRRTSSSLCTREANHKKIAPASPDENVETSGDAQHAAVHTSADQMKEGYVTAVDANGSHEKAIGKRKRKRKLPFYCCLYFLPGQVMG